LSVWLLSIYQAISLAVGYTAAVQAGSSFFLVDGHAYWASWRNGLYGAPPGQEDAYLYSPAFAQILWPLTVLPFWAFAVCWWGLLTAAYSWLLAPLAWAWRLPAIVMIVPDLVLGNIYSLFGLALVLAVRHPGAWALLLLTKVLPGLGLLWYLVRREWRPLVTALLTTAVVVGVSYAVSPSAWEDWLRFLIEQRHSTAEDGAENIAGLALRVGLAVVIVILGALSGHLWALPAAVVLAMPLGGAGTLGVLAALPRLVLHAQGSAR